MVCKSEVNILCDKLNEQAKAASNDIALQDFYRRTEVGWRDEFEKWFTSFTPFDCKDLLLSLDEWFKLYTRFASQVPKVLWTPFENNLTEFNFIVCEFVHDGFYNYFEFDQQKVERDWKFIRAYRNKQDARDFTEAHNKKLRMLKKEQAEKNLVEKNLVPKSNNLQTELLKEVESPKTFDWKEAMKALIDGKRVEARVCIPGLPESENGWFDLEFAIGPDDREFGESVKFGKDWDYRIKDDSKERKELFDECKKLGIINVSKASKISTPLLHDIVDAIKSIDLDWEGIAKQINEDTK